MKNLFFVIFMAFVCNVTQAGSRGPLPLRSIHNLPSTMFSVWTISEYENMTTHQATSSYTAMPFTLAAGGDGGTLSNTDDFGTVMNFTWSISGNTFSYSISVTPGTDVNMGIHSMYLYNDTPNSGYNELLNEGNEDSDYGNISWYREGSVNIDGSLINLALSFEVYTTLSSNPYAYCNNVWRAYIYK